MKLSNHFLSRRGFLLSSILGGLAAPFLKPEKVKAAPVAGFGPPVYITTKPVPNMTLPNVSINYTMVGVIGSFTVQNSGSILEVTYQGRVKVQSMTANAVIFQLRIDATLPTPNSGMGIVMYTEPNIYVPQTFSGYFTHLSQGTHSLQMWAVTTDDEAINAIVNPGTYIPEVVIIKEYPPFGSTYLPIITN